MKITNTLKALLAAAAVVPLALVVTTANASESSVARPAVAPVVASAPAQPFAVGSRQLALSRGADRPLPTTVWYPATGVAGRVTAGAAPADGRFPVVLLGHGLMSLPSDLAAYGTRWAAAGFVVAAPAFPFTKRGAVPFTMNDMVNQPADASQVISDVLALNTAEGDPLAGRLDTAQVAAAGHSAGGYTTTGMLARARDPRLRAAVVLAGAHLGGAFTGSPAPVLFVHGDADATVPYVSGRSAYDAVPWPKAFLTLTGGSHSGLLFAGGNGFSQVATTTTDFLRWTLYGDTAALRRLPADATQAGTSTWESSLGDVENR